MLHFIYSNTVLVLWDGNSVVDPWTLWTYLASVFYNPDPGKKAILKTKIQILGNFDF